MYYVMAIGSVAIVALGVLAVTHAVLTAVFGPPPTVDSDAVFAVALVTISVLVWFVARPLLNLLLRVQPRKY